MQNDVQINVSSEKKPTFWQQLWQQKIGPLPLPVYLIISTIVLAASIFGKLPADMLGGIAIMMVIGVLLGDIGMRVPVLKDIGGPAILSIFIPSILVFYKLLNPSAVAAIKSFTKEANFLYFYIACLVAGSILGMVRAVLIQGFVRMFIPLVFGTIASCIAGVAVGSLTGLGAYHSFFFVVIPILSGGVGEGILPLAVAYSEILNQSPDKFIGMLVPAAMLGNLFAIMSAGYLRHLGVKKPHLTGNGMLVRSGGMDMSGKNEDHPIDFGLMGAGLFIACGFYLFGMLASHFIPIPAPIIMILSAAIVKSLGIMPRQMEIGAYQLYRFVAQNLTWALLVGVGVLYTPWNEVVASITPAYIATVAATVLAMICSGFFIGRYLNMYPIEAAMVTGCHSGLGGTGDVAILSAGNRMELMPFAQIATRLGGACVVVLAAILMRFVS
ncbi:2-hydroxycarboxylate transporter family protein [Citrobacter portucalensis]|uniref:2-hydroxycarboxylate transporter family protein n=1 Tax=Citrobacter portucalensis TaxID=1639133 RepID=UPI00224322B4|nr:2-hydroxycarboxylate transporter family protein [Citrobacter portucalensis]MCW8353801.1 2-hydroxycarboxylate transporter family protein [Citrobacter portucalensis]MCX8992110.1 2-hydroxycarboxylate transporter family protein [Citrobacter portucalensis]MCX9006312.1 2-hydroxycarboxylate transporter family protein [Citrobacter portucalensis]MCX9053723.1 2-hydroxycarboxylate transporter family protein [Citrobacter portucalensis]